MRALLAMAVIATAFGPFGTSAAVATPTNDLVVAVGGKLVQVAHLRYRSRSVPKSCRRGCHFDRDKGRCVCA
jgi:hypothetical protein